MPGRFFPNTVELVHLRNLKWADFYQQCPLGQRMRFEREALLSLLTDAYFSDSDVELLMKVSRRKRKELRQAIQRGDPIVRPWKLTLPGTSPQKPERRSPPLSMKQAKAETKRLMEKRARAVLGWVFEQGNLFVEAELDGKCVSIPSLWVGRETQLTGSASPDGQPTVERIAAHIHTVHRNYGAKAGRGQAVFHLRSHPPVPGHPPVSLRETDIRKILRDADFGVPISLADDRKRGKKRYSKTGGQCLYCAD